MPIKMSDLNKIRLVPKLLCTARQNKICFAFLKYYKDLNGQTFNLDHLAARVEETPETIRQEFGALRVKFKVHSRIAVINHWLENDGALHPEVTETLIKIWRRYSSS